MNDRNGTEKEAGRFSAIAARRQHYRTERSGVALNNTASVTMKQSVASDNLNQECIVDLALLLRLVMRMMPL
ncbi:MAG: hypothetical protein ABII63_07410 [Pseudomonadota bacterium]